MALPPNPVSANDPYDLQRFVQAQAEDYEQALAELQRGKKESHWMWYIFPQFEGLGSSWITQRYSIKSLDEARAYLAHPLLGPRLTEASQALLQHQGKPISSILGYPDDLKLCSSATLFAAVYPADSVFHLLLQHFFAGVHDAQTLRLIQGK